MDFYAHTREDGEFQNLKDHLEGVAARSQGYADVFGAGYLGYLAGILHDIGKYSLEFQQRIRGGKFRVDHSTAGAQWIVADEAVRNLLGATRVDYHFAKLIAFAISGHHGGLLDHGQVDDESTLKHRLAKRGLPDWTAAWDEIRLSKDHGWDTTKVALASLWKKETVAWNYSFLGRMIYSCLVDADSIDTRDFCTRISEVHQATRPSLPELERRLFEFLSDKLEHVAQTKVNIQRRKILEACLRQAELPPQIFSLTVPTGGGKTLSSLAFALHHAVKHGMNRIIYVIPFTSIIEQNAERFREALGDDSVLEHHSNFDYDEYLENYGLDEVRRLKLSAENWDMPIVVTTSVQFFESVFSHKRSKCRKLRNIADSVIILDEAQSIPRGYMKPCLMALTELTASYGSSVVLCTATQPSWKGLGVHPIEIMDTPTPTQLAEDFKRVEVEIHGSNRQVTTDEQIVNWMENSAQTLCIVNTRKHAKVLYDELARHEVECVHHLSGRLCAKHRSDILKEVRDALHNDLPCRVISTQLIEAGVDVDFPLVLRAYAGLDSIAQAAGRCNREGLRDFGTLKVFYPEVHGMPSRGWMKETATEAQNTVIHQEESPLSLSCIEEYFERIHGIRDGRVEQITDSEGIISLLKDKNQNLEIPYEEISNRFKLIDGTMRTIVVPYDSLAEELIRELATSSYPLQLLRRLQAYTVQIYQHEFVEFQRNGLLRNVQGVLWLTEKSYYHPKTGLLSALEAPESEILIF